jgi:hypothetical protein
MSKHVKQAIPLQALTSPEGSRRLRFPDFKTIGNIRNVLRNCIFKAVNVREGVSKNLSFQIPHKKVCYRTLRMLHRTLSVASWPVYLGDGRNALTVMEDIS